ncbi:MAG: late competence development ComFB family protein [Spirochaetes bacterium]|nr:late competence development ComFB family protein [Spirochaetota bacterium]
MGIKERYDFSILTNESEQLVIAELDEELKNAEERGICVCDECVLDMAALALNMLKPHYRVSLLGTMYAQAVVENHVEEVKRAVTMAVAKVHSNPSHD